MHAPLQSHASRLYSEPFHPPKSLSEREGLAGPPLPAAVRCCASLLLAAAGACTWSWPAAVHGDPACSVLLLELAREAALVAALRGSRVVQLPQHVINSVLLTVVSHVPAGLSSCVPSKPATLMRLHIRTSF